jgi:predicted NUDIX family phosphoesterase
MNTQTQKALNSTIIAHDEHILVVERTRLFTPARQAWHGIQCTDIDAYVQMIYQYQEFKSRAAMELDPLYKQIIPYMIFQHNDRYFLMQRKATTSEQRLKNLYSLGIGGHVQQQDITSINLMDWAQREFQEEIAYDGRLNVTTLGIINDDTNDVGRVHLGLVLLLQGDSSNIAVKSELKSGQLLTLAECKTYYDHLESWSKFVLELLAKL